MTGVQTCALPIWRRAQIEQSSNTSSQTFDENLQSATAKINPNAVSNLYKSSESIASSQSDLPEKSDVPKDDGNIISADKLSQLGSVIESITGKSAKSYKQNINIPNVNAKLQLAMHLADEQKKIKAQNLENLKNSTIPSDKKKLSEVSRKLGIEKGGLETKAAMEKILKDKNKLKKLTDKFGL